MFYIAYMLLNNDDLFWRKLLILNYIVDIIQLSFEIFLLRSKYTIFKLLGITQFRDSLCIDIKLFY